MKKTAGYIRYLRKFSLVSQLILVISSLMAVILLIVVWFTYLRTSSDIIRQHFDSRKTLITIQSENAESYLSQLDDFSLLMRNDDRFMKMITTSKQFDYSSDAYVRNLVRNTFYTRNDLIDYKLYILNQNKSYAISRSNRNIRITSIEDILSDPLYSTFSQGRYYRAVAPSLLPSGMLILYRTIINIRNRKPLAFVRITVDRSWPQNNIGSSTNNEINALTNESGEIFYFRGTPERSRQELQRVTAQLTGIPCSKPTFIKYDSRKYMPVTSSIMKNGWQLVSLIPKHQLDAYTAATRNIGLIMGFLSIIGSIFLISLFIRLFTRPLSILAAKLRFVGQGNFKSSIDIGGCSEIRTLSHEFNNMTRKIDTLIEKNYVAELNWKNAQLVALKAQINPHFLYNTLQTLSAEAIENNQQKINDMVMALSSMLKYTIRGQDTVPLETELEHVRDYLFLQKQRFEERLTYAFETEADLKTIMIPKISIMTLVENSIIHGMSMTAETLHVSVKVEEKKDELYITVTDDGAGIESGKLEDIHLSLDSDNKELTGETIGLKNLSNRLKLMYGNSAGIQIYSTEHTGTTTVMVVPPVQGGGNV